MASDSVSREDIQAALVNGSFYESNNVPTFHDIGTLVERINKNYDRLEQQLRYDQSLGYRVIASAADAAISLFNKTHRRASAEELFEEQLGYVNTLNQALTTMIVSYDHESQHLHDSIAKMSRYATHDTSQIPLQLTKAYGKFKQVRSQSEQPSNEVQLYSALTQQIEADQQLDRARTEDTIQQIRTEKARKHLISLKYHEKIFRTLLNKSRELSATTEMYADILSDNVRIWKNVHNLANTVSYVGNTINELQSYHAAMNERYADSVSTIMRVWQENVANQNNQEQNYLLQTVLGNIRQVPQSR